MENREVITIICGQTLEVRIKYLCGGQTGCKTTLIFRLAFLLLPNALKEIFTQPNNSGSMIVESWQSNSCKAGALLELMH